jgi:hypothetical protein
VIFAREARKLKTATPLPPVPAQFVHLVSGCVIVCLTLLKENGPPPQVVDADAETGAAAAPFSAPARQATATNPTTILRRTQGLPARTRTTVRAQLPPTQIGVRSATD